MWLNEGFTSYVENRIVEAVFGKAQADEEFILAADELRGELTETPKPDQRLVPNFDGRDPDDAGSDFAYTKGAWLLRTLEASYGRDVFDPYLRGYFDHFAFQSITTDQMLAYLDENLIRKHPGHMSLDAVKAWIDKRAFRRMRRCRSPNTSRRSRRHAANFSRASEKPTRSTRHRGIHRNGCTSSMPAQEALEITDGKPRCAYHLTGAANAEIARRWYLVAIRSDYTPARDAMADYMTRIGRRYLVVPLYETLAKTPDGLAFARGVYAKAKPGYHPMTQASIEKALDRKK